MLIDRLRHAAREFERSGSRRVGEYPRCVWRGVTMRVIASRCCGDIEVFYCPCLDAEVYETKCRTCTEYEGT